MDQWTNANTLTVALFACTAGAQFVAGLITKARTEERVSARIDLAERTAESKMNALKIQHDSEIAALKAQVEDVRADQRETTEALRTVASGIQDLKEMLGKRFEEFASRFATLEAKIGQSNRRALQK